MFGKPAGIRRRWISSVSAVGLLVGALTISTASPTQAATNAERCRTATESQVYYGPYNVVTQKKKVEAGRIIAVESGKVDTYYGATVNVGWALLADADWSDPLSGHDRLKLQITKDGGDTVWASCHSAGGSAPYAGAEWYRVGYFYVKSDADYRFRACGYVPAHYDRAWFCTAWW